jgi:hypothetical protein
MSQPKNNHRTIKLLSKLFGVTALLGVLYIGFLGYLTPSMRINWETIATMCGF